MATDAAPVGVLMALNAFGPQDNYMALAMHFDARKLLLRGRYQSVYSKLDVEMKAKSPGTLVFTLLPRSTDLVNEVDLAIPNPGGAPLEALIAGIRVEVGGCRIDEIVDDVDLETHVRANCALMYGPGKRSISHINGTTFVPLAMAPFHESDLVRPSTPKHNVCVIVTLKQQPCDVDSTAGWTLYGQRYFLSGPERTIALGKPHEFVTTQNQRSRPGDALGRNAVHLRFNHPVDLIYFWGFDKAKVRNVALRLNGHDYYDGSLEALEHAKRARGFGDVEPAVMFFSQSRFDERPRGAIDFSRIDHAALYIVTDQAGDVPLHVVGLNRQPLMHKHDMYGVAYIN
jgi:hypothetical protein